MAYSDRSRLSRRLVTQTKRNFILIALGIIIIPILLFTVVLPFFAGTLLVVTGAKDTQSNSTNSNVDFVAPPTLNSLPDGTNKETITVSGTAAKNETISLYVNSDLVDKTQTKDDGTFTFDNISLSQGDNKIKAKAVDKNKKQSDFSQELTVTYLNKEPNLVVQSPNDGQTFSKDDSPITVAGNTDPNVKVTVNDSFAIVSDNGTFTLRLTLQNGDNTIKVIATDKAGNKKEQDIKVHYNP